MNTADSTMRNLLVSSTRNAMRSSLSIILSLALGGVLGCHGLQVSGRMVSPPCQENAHIGYALDQLGSRELETLVNEPEKREKIITEISAIIDEGVPSQVCILMMNEPLSLPSEVREVVFGPLIQKCIANEDVFIQWAGIYAADVIGDKDIVEDYLSGQYKSLLIRPDPTPWWLAKWWREEQNQFNRLNAAVAVAAVRSCLVKMIGEYNIQEARSVLVAIQNDNGEWYEWTIVHARESRSALTGRSTKVD